MSLKNTNDCNNCGACRPECPNTAISVGADIYEIDRDRCTECVGFYGDPQCSLVCPVDCCLPDPDHVETESDLLKRLVELYPDHDVGGDVPSHFRK